MSVINIVSCGTSIQRAPNTTARKKKGWNGAFQRVQTWSVAARQQGFFFPPAITMSPVLWIEIMKVVTKLLFFPLSLSCLLIRFVIKERESQRYNGRRNWEKIRVGNDWIWENEVSENINKVWCCCCYVLLQGANIQHVSVCVCVYVCV